MTGARQRTYSIFRETKLRVPAGIASDPAIHELESNHQAKSDQRGGWHRVPAAHLSSLAAAANEAA